MATEIEHKFLLRNSDWRAQVERSVYLCQGYLTSDAHCSVRVRIIEQQGFLGIKSATLGVQRQEYEYPIPLAEAQEILATLCGKSFLEKTRHYIHFGEHLWEIDEFAGENTGLIVAEIELSHLNEPFARPDWLGAEVSDDIRYYNSQLAQHPYQRWNDIT